VRYGRARVRRTFRPGSSSGSSALRIRNGIEPTCPQFQSIRAGNSRGRRGTAPGNRHDARAAGSEAAEFGTSEEGPGPISGPIYRSWNGPGAGRWRVGAEGRQEGAGKRAGCCRLDRRRAGAATSRRQAQTKDPGIRRPVSRARGRAPGSDVKPDGFRGPMNFSGGRSAPLGRHGAQHVPESRDS
jgi:hypothetical protein